MSWSDPWPMFWSGGMPGIVDHVEEGQGRLYEQFKVADSGGQHLMALEVFLQEINVIEKTANQLKAYRSISNSQGEQLDRIGFELKQSRLGLADNDYRRILGANIRASFSNGNATDMLETADALLGASDPREPELTEIFPARVCITIPDLTPSEVALFVPILGKVPAAGVGGCLLTFDTTSVLSFSDVDATPGIEVSGWYSDVDGTAGIEGAGWADVTEL